MRRPTLQEGRFEGSRRSESSTHSATHRPQSRTKTCSINLAPTPYLARVLSDVFVYQAPPTNGRCFQTLDILTLQRVPCPPEIQIPVLARKTIEAWPKGSEPRDHRCCRRIHAAQSSLRLPSNRSATLNHFRNRSPTRCCQKNSRQTLQIKVWFGRSLMAHFHRT